MADVDFQLNCKLSWKLMCIYFCVCVCVGSVVRSRVSCSSNATDASTQARRIQRAGGDDAPVRGNGIGDTEQWLLLLLCTRASDNGLACVCSWCSPLSRLSAIIFCPPKQSCVYYFPLPYFLAAIRSSSRLSIYYWHSNEKKRWKKK